jgi:fermentation-respiration switch protein FrsA (DUF1100 family)
MAARHESGTALSRRELLRSSALVGGAVLGATMLPGVASAARLRTTPAVPVSAGAAAAAPPGLNFFTDPALDFNARFALGAAGSGAAEVGETMTAINAANAAGGTLPAFVDAFTALGQRVGAIADQARRDGHLVSARGAHLRAAEYYAQVLFFILGTTTPAEEPNVYRQVRRHWEAYGALAEPRILKVKIPYQGTTIPGYFMRPDDSGRARPTVIVNNGSDAQSVEVFSYGGAAAVARGYNALIFEGPGQGAMLFERKIPFRYDWEKVITPIVSWLRNRSDVDRDRIALTGWSMGGELVVRAAAFEHRLVAVVADPGMSDPWSAWPAVVRDVQQAGDAAAQNLEWTQGIIPELTPSEAFTIKKRGEIFATKFLVEARAGQVPTDYALLSTTMEKFNCLPIADKVRTPTLVTKYEADQFVEPQAQVVYDQLRKPKALTTFTVAQGADFHCAPMAPQYRNEVVFDWLAHHLD